MEPCHLFVYGTLRRAAAHPMHRLLLPAAFVGFGSLQGRLYDLGGYPGAVASGDPAEAVRGEVYRLDEPAAILAALDQYEGCAAADPPPREYVRATADIRLDAGEVLRAVLYFYNRPTASLTRIPSGDYLLHRAGQ